MPRVPMVQGWRVDLDIASSNSCRPLMDKMLEMHKQGVRPLQYSRAGIVKAAQDGHHEVVKWWYRFRSNNVLQFDNLELEEVWDCIIPTVPDYDAFDTIHWFFLAHHRVDVMLVDVPIKDRWRWFNSIQARRLLVSAAILGVITPLWPPA